MKPNTPAAERKKNVIEEFMYQYFPYWPLFVILFFLSLVAALMYMKYAIPEYEINATILIKDEKKGADDSKLLEALNIYSSTKIVENEIEVIQSKELLKEVIGNLSLFASVYEDGHLLARSAYTTSPVAVEVRYPDKIKDIDRVDFSFSKKRQVVKMDGKAYPLNVWSETPYGELKFVVNPHKETKTTKKKLFLALSSPEQVLSKLSDNIRATPAGKLSTVINLTMNDEVPERGENILDNLLTVYNKAAISDKNVMSSNTLDFVEERIRFVVKELDSIETKLQNYRTKTGVVDLSEQGKLYLQSVGENDRMMTDLHIQTAMLDEVEKYVLAKDRQIGVVPAITSVKDPMLGQLLNSLFESEMQYEKLKKTIPGGNPTMYTLKTQIENLRPAILESIQNQRASLNANRSKLGAGTGMYTSILKGIPKKERDLLDISRQQAIKNDAYSFLLQKREEAAISYAAVVADSRTINHATASFLPISPEKTFVYLVSIVIGLLIGFSFVIIKELLTHKVQFRHDIERLTTIPVVAEVIKVKAKTADVYNNTKRQLSFIEQFRQLRASVALNGRKLKYRRILVTSSIAGEGKSFIANNLALSLAISGKKVVLVDLDLRHPKTTTMHDLNGQRGVAEFLENNEVPVSTIMYPTSNEKIFVVPAGYSDVNPTELLLNGDINGLLTRLEATFDFVLIDTCPVDPVTDAYILSESCDLTVFVVRHNFTPKSMIEMLEESHKVGALKNISIVFNGIRSRGFFKGKYGYGYGYGRKKVYGDHVYKSEAVQRKA